MSGVSRRDKTAAAGLESRRAGELDREPFPERSEYLWRQLLRFGPGLMGFP